MSPQGDGDGSCTAGCRQRWAGQTDPWDLLLPLPHCPLHPADALPPSLTRWPYHSHPSQGSAPRQTRQWQMSTTHSGATASVETGVCWANKLPALVLIKRKCCWHQGPASHLVIRTNFTTDLNGALYAYFVLMGADTIKKNKKKISDLLELLALLYRSTDLDFSGLFGFRWVLTHSAQEFMTTLQVTFIKTGSSTRCCSLQMGKPM